MKTKLKLISAKTEASVWAWLSLAELGNKRYDHPPPPHRVLTLSLTLQGFLGFLKAEKVPAHTLTRPKKSSDIFLGVSRIEETS